jgi:hypothetical protein
MKTATVRLTAKEEAFLTAVALAKEVAKSDPWLELPFSKTKALWQAV